MNILLFQSNIDVNALNEIKRVEEVVDSLGPIENIGSNIIINSSIDVNMLLISYDLMFERLFSQSIQFIG